MSGLFTPDVTPTPQREVTPMPDENDPSVLAARRRQYEIVQSRSGRGSTMLSDSYGNDRLGGRS